MELNWKPNYSCTGIIRPPKTFATKETAGKLWDRLKNFLVVSKFSAEPSKVFKHGDDRARVLYQPDGWQFEVKWSPVVEDNYRRLTYVEFLNWYNIQ